MGYAILIVLLYLYVCHYNTLVIILERILCIFQFSSVTQLCLTLCDLMGCHTRLSCPSPTPGVYPNWCPLSRWCHPTISSSVVPFSFYLQSFQWTFRTDSFRMDWLALLAVQRTLKSLLQHHRSKASILRCSAFL